MVFIISPEILVEPILDRQPANISHHASGGAAQTIIVDLGVVEQYFSANSGVPAPSAKPNSPRLPRRRPIHAPPAAPIYEKSQAIQEFAAAILVSEMSETPFVHLHCHTGYSLLDGACEISKLMDLVSEQKMPAVAMTDHGNLFGAVQFYNAAKAKDTMEGG